MSAVLLFLLPKCWPRGPFMSAWAARCTRGFACSHRACPPLPSFMIRAGAHIRLTLLKKWCRQILAGLAYMHGHVPPVIHRDLRLGNIFVDGRTGDIRIGNFQLAHTSATAAMDDEEKRTAHPRV